MHGLWLGLLGLAFSYQSNSSFLVGTVLCMTTEGQLSTPLHQTVYFVLLASTGVQANIGLLRKASSIHMIDGQFG